MISFLNQMIWFFFTVGLIGLAMGLVYYTVTGTCKAIFKHQYELWTGRELNSNK